MGFDLLLLQDPYPNFNLPLNSPLGFSQFFSNSLSCAIVCYNRNIICNFCMKTDHTVSVNIKLNQVLLTVINVYFPPHGDFSEAFNQLNLYKEINKNCLLAGDFNARSVVWGYKITDRRGDILTDFLLSNNLHLCNIPGLGPTFHGPRSAVGNPDLTPTSCDLISFVENWEILSTESLSDHSFISVHLRCDLTFSDFVFKTKYGINKFINNFRKNYNLLNSFLTNISSIELLDDFASLLINTTNASAFSTLRKRRVLNTPSFKWWNNSLRIQRNKLNAYKRRLVSLTTHGMSVDEIASMRSRYKTLRANYKKSIIDTKNKAWEYFCFTNSNNFGFTFKATFGKLSSPTNPHQNSTGDPASLFHSKVSLLLDYHFPSGSSPIHLVFNDCSPPSCLSPSEVEVVFRKLRGGKAPDVPFFNAVGFEGARPSGGIPFLKLIPIPSISLSHINIWVSTLTIAYLGLSPHINSIKDKILWISSNFYRVSKNFNHQHISLMKLWYTSVVQAIISYGAGIVRVQYFVRGGFVSHRSRASSEHLFPHLPVDELDSSGVKKGLRCSCKMHVWVSGPQRSRLDVDVSEK
ncbi:hypothetical protein TNCV_395311 [Trichonephila clavipes]|nr:hypothetical protein TNCV_395311 [Trichonephila clavipes]